MVRPHDVGQEADGDGGGHHETVAEQFLAAEGRQDLGDHAERGQNQHVHLGMTKKPEDVLKQHRITAAGGQVTLQVWPHIEMLDPEAAGLEAQNRRQPEQSLPALRVLPNRDPCQNPP